MVAELSGITRCGKPWRCVCQDRKHPDGKRFLILITQGSEEIGVAVSNLNEPVKSQWFREELIYLLPEKVSLQKYVVGFLFSFDLSQVVLVTKNRPQWQAGLLNGVGGKVEGNESLTAAMTREFREEADAHVSEWSHIANMTDDLTFSVDVFASTFDLSSVGSATDEHVAIYHVSDILTQKTVENVPWLILMAIDALQDGRPGFVKINYEAPEAKIRK